MQTFPPPIRGNHPSTRYPNKDRTHREILQCAQTLWTSTLASIAAIVLGVATSASLRANDPGGSSGTANVTLSVSGTSATLANGAVTAVINTSSGRVSSYLFKGAQMLDTSAQIYYSMDGGTSYEGPQNCVYSATVNTADMVDVSCKQTWTSTGGYIHAFNIDVHYVLRRGDTGLYSYVVLDHPASYPAVTMGEWRMVWRQPHDTNDFYFERAYVDTLRHWKTPTYFDYQNDTATAIPEATLLTTGGWNGQYSCKYMYNAEYYEIKTWGTASDVNRKGAWFVLGSMDYLNDGPNMRDLTIGEGYTLLHFGRDHFGGSNTNVAAGEAWRKMFGPFLLYCNDTATTTNAGNVLWGDAQAQATAESAAQPYSWLTYQPEYPVASARGRVTGTLSIIDPVRSGVNGNGNSWVGLSQPDAGGNWQFESKRYQYWSKTDGAGGFSIGNVRPGTYTLTAFANGSRGAVGEYTRTNVVVSANTVTALGTVTWTVPHPGATIAWEIGVPDRSAAEFKHGNTDYYKPFLWKNYRTEFTNPLNYNIGSSTPANDWNYAHSPWFDANGAVSGTWKWNINFNLSSVPASGNATLTLAWAGSNAAEMKVYVNSASTVAADIFPQASGGNGLIREGIHCKYAVEYVTIPVSKLKVGSNTITLEQANIGTGGGSTLAGVGNHVMYDYLSLEMPNATGPVVYQAESASLSAGSTIDTANAGYTGTGYTNSPNAVGAYIEWTITVPTAGTRQLAFRFSNGSTAARPAEIRVNGAVAQASQSFPTTPDFVTWPDVLVNETLVAGQNTIRLTATTANGLANMDKLTVP